VGVVSAVDVDQPPYNRVIYRLTSDALGTFDIDRNTGVIVTATQLDREQVSSRDNKLASWVEKVGGRGRKLQFSDRGDHRRS